MDSLQTKRKSQREAILASFNENENGLGTNGIFGLPFGAEESEIILLPVPWETTVSYQAGTGDGAECIIDASPQLDLYNPLYAGGWKAGIYAEEVNEQWLEKGKELRAKSEIYIQALTDGMNLSLYEDILNEVNNASDELNSWVEHNALQHLNQDKIVGVIGGEHSVPYGLLKALTQKHTSFGILQIDAHADLRQAYEGFTHSHASIFYNVMQMESVTKLIQVGLRDISISEIEYALNSGGRISQYPQHTLDSNLFDGKNWKNICTDIVSQLPDKVYISFDIDGLDPSLCPNTGTPVPGGLSYPQAIALLEEVALQGKTIIGFDLCEVAPGKNPDWNGNVGARILYSLCLLTAKTNGL